MNRLSALKVACMDYLNFGNSKSAKVIVPTIVQLIRLVAPITDAADTLI